MARREGGVFFNTMLRDLAEKRRIPSLLTRRPQLTKAEKEGKSRKEMTEVVKNFKPDSSYISDLEKELKAELKAAA